MARLLSYVQLIFMNMKTMPVQVYLDFWGSDDVCIILELIVKFLNKIGLEHSLL